MSTSIPANLPPGVSVNYARLNGIEKSELAGAIVFAAAYVPLALFFTIKCFKHLTYVLVMLTLFCQIRVAAFVLRALISGSDTAGENINLVIAAQVIYSVGFFGLLYSAYTLVLDRRAMLPKTSHRGLVGIITSIMGNRHIVRIILTAAVALGVVGGVKSAGTSQSSQDDAQTFRRISIYIFLAISVLLVIVTASLARDEHKLGMRKVSDNFGQKYRLVVLLAISLLCLAREAFFAATSKNVKQQNNAHLFYPLSALLEFLAVILFAVPGLVPSRRELAEREIENQENVELTYGYRG